MFPKLAIFDAASAGACTGIQDRLGPQPSSPAINRFADKKTCWNIAINTHWQAARYLPMWRSQRTSGSPECYPAVQGGEARFNSHGFCGPQHPNTLQEKESSENTRQMTACTCRENGNGDDGGGKLARRMLARVSV